MLILAGYILMHTTFYLLLTRSRKLGSSFWLPLAILSSAVLALLIALPIAMALKIKIDIVALTEALPFLVCTIGFDKPLRLARAVFGHPHLTVPPADATPASANGLAVPSAAPATLNLQTLKPAPKIITEALTMVYQPLIRDYLLEIAVLAIGAYSRVGGLSEVCALAALLLTVDCILMCTYLSAILGVMVEVRFPFYMFRLALAFRFVSILPMTSRVQSLLTFFCHVLLIRCHIGAPLRFSCAVDIVPMYLFALVLRVFEWRSFRNGNLHYPVSSLTEDTFCADVGH